MCLMNKGIIFSPSAGVSLWEGRGGQGSQRSGVRRRGIQGETHHARPFLPWSGAHLFPSWGGSRAFGVLQPQVFGHHYDLGGESAL